MALQVDAAAELGLWFKPAESELGRAIVEARRLPADHVFPNGPVGEAALRLDESKLVIVPQHGP